MSSDIRLKVIGYCRESTREQAKYGFNLDDQEKKIRKYVDVYFADNSYSLTVMREEGASAKSLNRPKMNELMSLVRKKSVDTIIIHNLDRLTRQVKDLATLLEEFEKYDVSLISITEKIDTKSPMGRFFIYMIVLIAQWEWETISSRSIRGIEESARQGNYALPGAPIGYMRNPDDNHKLIVNEEEAEVIRRIFNSIAYRHYTAKALASELNKEKVLSRKWNDGKINNILENKIYYGTFERFGIEYPNHTPPIITKDLYDDANAFKMHMSTKAARNQYLYKGIVFCKQCGKRMILSSTKKNDLTYLYYRCTTCKKQIPEDLISERYFSIFDSMMKIEHFEEELSRLIGSHDDDKLMLLTYEMISSGKSNDEIVNQIIFDQSEHKKYVQLVKTLRTRILSISFEKTDFVAKRKFLLDHVKMINYDCKKQKLSIEFQSEKMAV